MVTRQRCAFALTLGLLGGCGLIVDTNGLSGGGPDTASEAEAGTPNVEPPAPDAQADSTFDASVPYCASRTNALFCDDFDRTTPLAALWDSTTLPGDIGMIASSYYDSAPSSLALVADAAAAPLAYLSLRKVVPVGSSAVTFRFHFRTDRAGNGPSVIQFKYDSGFGYYAYLGETMNVRVGGPVPETNVGNALIGVNRWRLIEFLLEPPAVTGAGYGRLTVKVDGAEAIAPLALDPAANAYFTTNAAIDVGILYLPSGSWSGWLDDVEIESKP
ncbi:hypothetical protein AKJ09_05350 [Labilithrix luteola]|uniref:Uncharacterized protein n=1 Tax=Labilithrix luteola TaxID=1391654 RepID=A0A0K1PZ61_9BACT|nr:hypothetical protein [Labilithrix luteola]AKU98686.1 hypothetical protein AKJ09_05350 [Labilithrix luteola]